MKSELTTYLREWDHYNNLFNPADDEGNPYQHLFDSEEDDVTEGIRLGLSVHDMTLGLKRKVHK